LVTGAGGHFGRAVREILRSGACPILPVDVDPDGPADVVLCDLTSKNEVSGLFHDHSIRTVIHLAAVLPSAFQSDPLARADALMREAVDARVKHFIFARFFLHAAKDAAQARNS
jgi:nucleoside-diphosphate-sugar epimerase